MEVSLLLYFFDRGEIVANRNADYLKKILEERYQGAKIESIGSDHIIFNIRNPVGVQAELCKSFGYDRVSMCSSWRIDDVKPLLSFAHKVLRENDVINILLRPLSGYRGNITDVYYRISNLLISDFNSLRFDEMNPQKVLQIYLDDSRMYGELYGCLTGGGIGYGLMGQALSLFLGDKETYASSLAALRSGFSLKLVHPYVDDSYLRNAVFKSWQLVNRTMDESLEFILIKQKVGQITADTIMDATIRLAKESKIDRMVLGNTLSNFESYRPVYRRYVQEDIQPIAPNMISLPNDMTDLFNDDDYLKLNASFNWLSSFGNGTEYNIFKVKVRGDSMGWHRALDRLISSMLDR